MFCDCNSTETKQTFFNLECHVFTVALQVIKRIESVLTGTKTMAKGVGIRVRM